MSGRLPETDDYGLGPGEVFEPDLPEEPPFDLSKPHVMTVLGPIEPDALGLALPHEHLIAEIPGPEQDEGARLDDEHLALGELEDFYVIGGRGIVDATPADWGRDLSRLRWIAERSPVTIVAATGAGRPAAVDEPVDRLAGRWIDELRDGASESGVKPGVIVVDAESGEEALRAAARASFAIGVPILTTASVALVCRVMSEEGVDSDRVIVTVLGNDLERSAGSVLAAGCWLLIDRIGTGPGGIAGLPEQARQASRLIEAGYGGRLLCSVTCTASAEWRSGGGEGWGMILERWPLALMEFGVDAPTVRQLLVENPAEALAVRR